MVIRYAASSSLVGAVLVVHHGRIVVAHSFHGNVDEERGALRAFFSPPGALASLRSAFDNHRCRPRIAYIGYPGEHQTVSDALHLATGIDPDWLPSAEQQQEKFTPFCWSKHQDGVLHTYYVVQGMVPTLCRQGAGFGRLLDAIVAATPEKPVPVNVVDGLSAFFSNDHNVARYVIDLDLGVLEVYRGAADPALESAGSNRFWYGEPSDENLKKRWLGARSEHLHIPMKLVTFCLEELGRFKTHEEFSEAIDEFPVGSDKGVGLQESRASQEVLPWYSIDRAEDVISAHGIEVVVTKTKMPDVSLQRYAC